MGIEAYIPYNHQDFRLIDDDYLPAHGICQFKFRGYEISISNIGRDKGAFPIPVAVFVGNENTPRRETNTVEDAINWCIRNPLSVLVDGRIPAHTECPYRNDCVIAAEGRCYHLGVAAQAPFSCAVARGFALTASIKAEEEG